MDIQCLIRKLEAQEPVEQKRYLASHVRKLIREYAAPRTRPDWRTCKALEAISIKAYHDWYNPLVYDDPWQDEVYDMDLE
jgi:hypothetical protein